MRYLCLFTFHSTVLVLLSVIYPLSSLLSGAKLQSFKWQEYLSWQRKVNEAKTSAEALKASLGKLNQEKKHQESKWKTFFRRTRLEEIQVVKNNILYLHNIYEVAVLFSTRRSFLLIKSKSG
ncbi:protein S-acyltransferase [Salvia divinorum]|uniref:Protein S-acyltransferase n=1 Tax=Salvia divinorum TaxID=28513 RepID=A0ABD1HIU0_SALDI